MFGRLVQRRLFSNAAVRFPEGTVAGHYKAAVAAKGDRDAVRFDNQKINWTVKEIDVSSLTKT